MAEERFFIGPGLRDKLREVIYRVDGMPQSTSGARMQSVYSGIAPPPGSPQVKLAAYPRAVTWRQGATQEVITYSLSGGRLVESPSTHAATNYCNTFPAGGPEGPSSTMTWCIVAKNPGGGYMAVEGPSMPAVKLAAYPRTVTWAAGSQQTVTLYTHNGTSYGPSGEGTALATNFCNTFESHGMQGPTSTMAWCLVSDGRGGVSAAIEGPLQPFRIATFTGSWSKNALKTVSFKFQSASPNTVQASNLFAEISGSDGTAAQTRNCAIAREGTAWYLVAAEC